MSVGHSRPAPAGLTVQGLRCEYLVDPLGIDVLQPRLSWVLQSALRGQRQSAYQILVASSAQRLSRNKGDLWDSGKVLSDRSIQVPYGGKPMQSGLTCYWKVRAWDKDGRPGRYSAPATWEMGLLHKTDWQGRWIGYAAPPSEAAVALKSSASPAPLLRRSFDVRGKVRQARAYVCGLGYFELHLNGRKVGDHQLDPGYTRYDRRDLYVTFDVTPYLKAGRNAVGAMLGTGWYDNSMLAAWDFEKAPWRARPKLLLNLRLDYEDGRTTIISSDGGWKASTGPILYDNIYGGETYDARLEKVGWDTAGYNDADWQPVQTMGAPGGALTAQEMPPIRVMQVLKPVKLTEPKPGVYIFDMGQNFAGVPELSVQGPAGARVQMVCAEKLHADGTLDAGNIDAFVKRRDPAQVFQTDTYILKGNGREVWRPRFSYNGFQYVEVTGFPGQPTLDSVRGLVQHSAFRPAGHFECSNPLLNAIQRNTLWSYISNFQGIPTDCPHREKNGWTGDAQLAAEQGMMNFDPAANYVKWLNDLKDEQQPGGALPGIVPTGGWGYAWGNGPAWDSAYPLIAWDLYQYYDDVHILQTHYEHLRRYVDYLTTRAKDGIVSIGLGDWVAPGPTAPVAVTDTAYYYQDALVVSRAAALLGKADDAHKYAALAESIKQAFNAKFLDPATGRYADGSQTAQSCALYQGLVPPEHRAATLQRLLDAIEGHQGHIFTGILGAKYVMNSLLQNGRADVAYTIATQKTAPGWGNWIERGATTLWEDWGGGSSRNHIMFGDISAWFYKALAGINGDPAAPGFKHFFIKPQLVGDLTAARGEYDSIHGKIVSDWRLEKGVFHLTVTVPVNTTATVYLPGANSAQVTESGRPATPGEGVRFIGVEDGRSAFAVGSGTYAFAVPYAGAAVGGATITGANGRSPVTTQNNPAALPVQDRPIADRLGVAHVDGKYHFTDRDFLNEGANRILELGSRVIKVWFVANEQGKYPFNSQWPKVNSLVELAQTPYFRSLFGKPFTTFILETYAFGRDDHYWTKSISDADATDEARQFEELTRYLLTTYAGTGKTFVLQNWEGDWAARGHYNRDVVPAPIALAGMIRWLNARQDGVDHARRALHANGVHVYHAAEVNLVAPAMEGKTSVTNDVFPHTHCDLYSYSAYDTSIEGTHFRAALDYIASKAPPSAAFGAKNVMVGEFGIPENDFGTDKSVASVRRTIQEALDWGCPYLAYWQIYDNECKAGKSDEKGDCRGFWLIKPSGQKSALWDVLHGFLAGGH